MRDIANNPAGRLHRILAAARAKPPNFKTRQVWAQVLEIDEKDTAALLGAIADIIYLVRDAKAAVQSVGDLNSDVYLKSFKPIEGALARATLEIRWDQFSKHIDESTMARLEVVADILSKQRPEPMPNSDDLAEVSHRIDELFDITVAASLPQQLKSAIQENLD
jgi:hypothetical protein